MRVARIPGRDMVGVEVPNPKSRVVLLRELLEDEQWAGEERLLPVTLGLDLEGRPVIADLAKMPHLLIAGATGTGKSVGINAIITSLIYHYQHKEDLRLLMIDPKMVELSMYKELPHLRHPVVTNNKEAARVLKWAVGEMDRRYALLEANGARNLSDFNRKVLEGKPLRYPAPRKVTLTDIAVEAADTPPVPPVPQEYTEGKLPLIVMVVPVTSTVLVAAIPSAVALTVIVRFALLPPRLSLAVTMPFASDTPLALMSLTNAVSVVAPVENVTVLPLIVCLVEVSTMAVRSTVLAPEEGICVVLVSN